MNRFCGNCFNNSLNDHQICSICGFDDNKNYDKAPHALPPGTILNGRYIIGRTLGQGGFGITYTARDHQTGQLVAVKEFFPDSMAIRTNAVTVTPFSGERGENFGYGKESFLHEAETMAEFIGNPNIVRVYSYFEENGTAYFVMEYVDGVSFQEYIKSRGGRLTLKQALEILFPVMDALSAVHEKGIIHRDVAPDNIYISKDGMVKLLDFGAARYSLGNVSRSLDVILKHGFAPKEQYKRRGRQGPYTDVYSTAATLYYAITGTRPDDAIERSDEDEMPYPSSLNVRITQDQEDVLLKAMAVDYQDRYQTMAQFQDAMNQVLTAPDPLPAPTQKPKQNSVPTPQAVRIDNAEAEKKELPAKKKSKKLLVALFIILLLSSAVLSASVLYFSGNNTLISAVNYIKIEIDTLRYGEIYTMANSDHIRGRTNYDVSSITNVSFLSSLDNAPSNAKDISDAKDGTILCWIDNSHLFIASDGRIALNQDSSYLFYGFENLKNIDFGEKVISSGVTDMSYMFANCSRLTELNLDRFDTASVCNMKSMFSNCTALKTLDLSSFDTQNVTNMNCMFFSCKSLTQLDLSHFNTSQVTDMAGMFNNCYSISRLDLSSFDVSHVDNMYSIFVQCNFELPDWYKQ